MCLHCNECCAAVGHNVCIAANVLAVGSSLSLYILLSVFHVPDTERRHLGHLHCQHDLGHSVAQVVICWLSVQKPIFNTVPVCEGFIVD